MGNKFLKSVVVWHNKLSGAIKASPRNGKSEVRLHFHYWPVLDTPHKKQLEIWTDRGQSFVLQGDDVSEFLDMMQMISQVDKEQLTLAQMVEVNEQEKKAA